MIGIKSKILIIHAENDGIISVDHSKDLIKVLNEKRDQSYPQVRFVEIQTNMKLCHKRIFAKKEIFPIIK